MKDDGGDNNDGLMMDLPVRLLQCVVSSKVTDRAHHTDSVHPQSRSQLSKLRSETLKLFWSHSQMIECSERIRFELNNNQQQVWNSNQIRKNIIIMKICRLKYLHPEAEPRSLTANTILIYYVFKLILIHMI